MVVGTMRLVGGAEFPIPGYGELARQPSYMGQDLLNPPSVEGWHTGDEWITSGNLVERVNFMSALVGDPTRPGVRSIVAELRGRGRLSPGEFVDATLHLMGALTVESRTRRQLLDHVSGEGDLVWSSDGDVADSESRVLDLLQLIVAVREYQLA